jgi:predicted secreted protein
MMNSNRMPANDHEKRVVKNQNKAGRKSYKFTIDVIGVDGELLVVTVEEQAVGPDGEPRKFGVN